MKRRARKKPKPPQAMEGLREQLDRVRARAERSEEIAEQCAVRMLEGNASMWIAYIEQLGIALGLTKMLLSHCAELRRTTWRR